MKHFHPMAILLKFEGYPPAVIASLFMHGCLLVFILGKSVDPSDYVTLEDPVIIAASTVDVNPQRLRRLERLELERLAEQERQQAAERDRQQRLAREREAREAQEAADREAAERRRQEELARQQRQAEADAEAERQRLAEDARRRTEAQRLLEEQRLAQEQADRAAQASQLSGENLIVADYSGKIRQIISQNWLRPPSARNGMEAVVRVQLVPTGEVVNVTLIQSSGDSAYDRSVVQAVERAERFPELQGMQTGIFERNFRTFNLLFRPEDLLR